MSNRTGTQRHRVRLERVPECFQRFRDICIASVTVMDDIVVSKHVKFAAGMGSKFVYPTLPNIQPRDILSTATAIKQVGDFIVEADKKNRVLGQLWNTVTAFEQEIRKCNGKRDPIIAELIKTHEKTREFLGKNKNVVICEADKGKRSLICLKETIEKKRNDHIRDTIEDGTYRQIAANDDIDIGKIIEEIHKNAEKSHRELARELNLYIEGGTRKCTYADLVNTRIPNRKTPTGRRYETWAATDKIRIAGDRELGFVIPQYRNIKNEAYSMAKLYVTIKVHKGDTYPIRPIIAAPATIGASLEEWLLKKLELLITAKENREYDGFGNAFMEDYQFIAKNTDTVIDGLAKYKLKDSHRIISLDFVSMYTNIDRKQALCIVDREFETIAKKTSVPKELFMKALKFLMHHNAYFVADGSIFYQEKGLPMGGKLSKILSEIVTAKGTINAIAEAMGKGFEFSFIYKYVDDFLVGVCKEHDECTIEKLVEIFEKHIPGMKVTFETEATVDDTLQLKYLEFTTIRCSDHDVEMNTIWSRQKYASQRMINAYSDIPIEKKHNTIREVLRKAMRYSSDPYKKSAITAAIVLIGNNGYTKRQIMSILENMPDYMRLKTDQKISTVEQQSDMKDVPFDNRQSNRKRRTCAKCGTGFRSRRANPICPNRACASTENEQNKRARCGSADREDNYAPTTWEGTPEYVRIPNIKGLDLALNEILRSHGLNTRFAAAAQTNGLFKNIKDKPDNKFASMVTFAGFCTTCGQRVFANAIDTTVHTRAENMKPHQTNHDRTHKINWEDAQIIARHDSAKRAQIGLEMLEIVAQMSREQVEEHYVTRTISEMIDC